MADTIHFVTPKLMPTTRPKGQTSLRPRRPSITASSRNGTTRHSIAVIRPVIGEMASTSSNPPVLAAMSTGRPTAPNATGTVLASRAIIAERMGEKPMATSIAAVIATGAPNPARASSRPPKENAMSIASTRGSSLIRKNVRRRSSKRPDATVTSYIQMAVSRIHTMGKMP